MQFQVTPVFGGGQSSQLLEGAAEKGGGAEAATVGHGFQAQGGIEQEGFGVIDPLFAHHFEHAAPRCPLEQPGQVFLPFPGVPGNGAEAQSGSGKCF